MMSEDESLVLRWQEFSRLKRMSKTCSDEEEDHFCQRTLPGTLVLLLQCFAESPPLLTSHWWLMELR